MKKLTAEESKNLVPVTNGRTSRVIAEASTLLMGETLIITRDDWKSKRPPYQAVDRLAKRTGRKFVRGRTPDGKGWMVTRVG